ncbi:MAG: small multi-drug export protein [Solobacterium sp.]|nr:small multi-drug export protein [Solobacterium sp.]
MNGFITWFMATIGQHISPELSVFIVSMLPLIELRGGIIVARLLAMPMWKAIIICIIGNIVPIPFILLLIKKILHWMADHHMSGIANWLLKKAEKNRPQIEKYGFWGLALFVGIPLPGTGAWTGSLVASVFDMDLKQASLSILIGIAIATVIMTTLSYGVFHL